MNKVVLVIVVGTVLSTIFYMGSSNDGEVQNTNKQTAIVFEKDQPAQQKAIADTVTPAKNTNGNKFPEIDSSVPVRDKQAESIQTYETVIAPLFEDSLKAAYAGNWKEFLEYSELIAQDDEYMPTIQLVTAIKQNAPIYVIEELLKNGARWNTAHANISVRMRNKQEIIEYMNLGMDIHIHDPTRDNPINAMVMSIFNKNNARREVFTFLLDSGVEIRKGSDGQHPITKALISAKKNEEAIFYIFQMMKKSPAVTDEQILLAKELNNDNPRAYNLLKRNVPKFSEALNNE